MYNYYYFHDMHAPYSLSSIIYIIFIIGFIISYTNVHLHHQYDATPLSFSRCVGTTSFRKGQCCMIAVDSLSLRRHHNTHLGLLFVFSVLSSFFLFLILLINGFELTKRKNTIEVILLHIWAQIENNI